MRNLYFSSIWGSIKNGSWSDIEKLIENIKTCDGDIQVEMRYQYDDYRDDDNDDRPYLFILRKVSPYYFPAKLDADNELWHYYNEKGIEEAGGERKIEAEDGYRDALTMTLDYDLVLSMAKEFYETSDVKALDYC